MKAFILLSVFAVALAGQQCGENQHYNSCGTACPLTCDNYDNPPRACVLMCNPGCHCDAGYVKTKDGSCVKPEECPAKAQPVEKSCLAKPDPGMCLAYMPMWYYDVKSEKCHEFVYGGCQGNGNRYRTEEECMQHCEGVRMRESAVGVCDLPAETGVCRGYFPKYYFDRTTGECKRFIYGGCGGNENKFDTEDECKQICGVHKTNAVCSLPAVTGPCKAYFRRFHFNVETGACEEFVYGGCRGNGNNFNTEEECLQACASEIETETTHSTMEESTGIVIPQKFCQYGYKLCVNGKQCIPGLLLCDGVEDCEDGSDETNCRKASVCPKGFYFCSDRASPPCVSSNRVCNGVMDCSDGSDESLCDKCTDTFCLNGGKCSIQEQRLVCKCKPTFYHNRCIGSTISHELEK